MHEIGHHVGYVPRRTVGRVQADGTVHLHGLRWPSGRRYPRAHRISTGMRQKTTISVGTALDLRQPRRGKDCVGLERFGCQSRHRNSYGGRLLSIHRLRPDSGEHRIGPRRFQLSSQTRREVRYRWRPYSAKPFTTLLLRCLTWMEQPSWRPATPTGQGSRRSSWSVQRNDWFSLRSDFDASFLCGYCGSLFL